MLTIKGYDKIKNKNVVLGTATYSITNVTETSESYSIMIQTTTNVLKEWIIDRIALSTGEYKIYEAMKGGIAVVNISEINSIPNMIKTLQTNFN